MSMNVEGPSLEVNSQGQGVNALLATLRPALQRLDRILDWAVRSMNAGQAEKPAPFRGLYITPEQVSDLLSREPGVNQFGTNPEVLEDRTNDLNSSDSLTWLVDRFGLSSFEADLVLLALAPEFDLRYEKIYAYLQDDVTRKLPTVELALNLLCDSAEAKLDHRVCFSPKGPLIRHGLLRILPDPNQVEPSFPAYYLKLDQQITRFLLGDPGLDPRLAQFCEVITPTCDWQELSINLEVKGALPSFTVRALTERESIVFFFHGPRGSERRATAEALAKTVGMQLLRVRVDRMTESSSFDGVWNLVFREAQIRNAIAYVEALDDFRWQTTAAYQMLDALLPHQGITVLAGRQPWSPAATTAPPVINVPFEILDFVGRQSCWRAQLAGLGIDPGHGDLDTLAARFSLTAGQIANAAMTAKLSLQWEASLSATRADPSIPTASPDPSGDALAAAARAQCGHELANLARKIEPRYGWQDIILPADQMAQLNEICSQAEFRHIVFGKWGFDYKLSLGKGLNVLFCGPPGTGKTMAAEVIARELRLDLYRIDLSQVVNKYIGETEKNLDRIFSAAENSNAILFFDEADALFGKRSEVRDSHDRYANLEISYLLQKMEEYQGISILATNLRKNLDEAFERRLQAVVEFPFPDEVNRRQIWENIFPKEAPLGDDVRFELLAKEIQLAGGNIKNMALTAAFTSAANGGVIGMDQLIHAAYREHQKIGRSWNEAGLLKASLPLAQPTTT